MITSKKVLWKGYAARSGVMGNLYGIVIWEV